MLSYQHGYHAGNRADVLKHAVLDVLLRHLAETGRPVLHVETHAGHGAYDLTGPQARKTAEAEAGALALLASKAPPAPLVPWLDHVRRCGKRRYPGSPLLAGQRLGDQARLVLFEKHPAEFDALRKTFEGDGRAQIKKEDGYSGALRLAPRRSETLHVFADPSYETMADMEALAEWVPRALSRWPHAWITVWLPLFKDEREAEFGAFLAGLEDGIVAGARWRAEPDKDTALEGSAIIAYRVPKTVRRQASEIAVALEALWQG